MNKKKLFTLVGSLALVGVIGIGATLAYFTDSDTETNVVTMGHVDIDLDEPIFSQENENNTITGVVPNQPIYKDPIISVQQGSEDAYIRAKIEFTGLDDTQIKQLRANINVDKSKWYYNETDQYYYYQGTLLAGQEVYLFDTVVIPASWGNEIADETFQIKVTAEAIQARNFSPRIYDNTIVDWNGVTADTYPQQGN